MRKRKKSSYYVPFIVVACIFTLAGFTMGYYINLSRLDQEKRLDLHDSSDLEGNIKEIHEDIEYIKMDTDKNDEEKAVTQYSNHIEKNTQIRLRTLYTACQCIHEDLIEAEEPFIGLNEEGLKEYILKNQLNWNISKFSTDEVILFHKRDYICPNHYLVSESDGYIVVYQFDENGEKILIEKTSIPISVLPAVDQTKLKRGILLNSREEVNQLLEDYSS